MNFRSFYSIFFFKPDGFTKRLLALLFICLIGTQYTNAQETNPSPIENIALLRQKVAQFLTDEYKALEASKVDIKVGTLDPRLRLAACDQTLAFNLLDTTGNGGNVNVQVVCNGSAAGSGRWNILVPALATVFRPVAIAGRAIQRGEQIAAADVVIDIRDMTQYRQGYTLKPDLIIGKEAKYPLNKGEAFRNSVLGAPLVIKRGEEVSIEAVVGTISVVTNGIATGDGRLGQQIRVKNNQSERIINARVVGPGKVQSLM